MFVCSVAASVERRDLLERGAEAAGVLRAQRAPLPRPAAAPPPGGGAQEDEAASHLQPGTVRIYKSIPIHYAMVLKQTLL